MAKRPERRADRTERGSVLSLLDSFLVSAQQNVAPATYDLYEGFLKEFAGFVIRRPLCRADRNYQKVFVKALCRACCLKSGADIDDQASGVALGR